MVFCPFHRWGNRLRELGWLLEDPQPASAVRFTPHHPSLHFAISSWGNLGDFKSQSGKGLMTESQPSVGCRWWTWDTEIGNFHWPQTTPHCGQFLTPSLHRAAQNFQSDFRTQSRLQTRQWAPQTGTMTMSLTLEHIYNTAAESFCMFPVPKIYI